MRKVVMAIAIAVACTGCGTVSETSGGTAASRTPVVGVNTVDGAPEVATAVSVGDTVVAQTWMWADDPLTWSDDDGQTWHASEMPQPVDRRGDHRLLVVGDTVLLVATPESNPARDPGIWYSIDRGRTFRRASGVAAATDEGMVTDVVALDGQLVAFGKMRADATMESKPPTVRAARWVSTDNGASWSRQDPADPAPVPTNVVAADGALVATVSVTPPPAGGDLDTHPIHSTDRGRTWQATTVPRPTGGDGFVPPVVVDGTVYLSTPSSTWASTDGGATWSELGDAPPMTDDAGNESANSSVRVGARSGNVLVAAVDAFFNYDHYLASLGWSDDDGASWHAASFPLHCDGSDASSTVGPVVAVDDVLVTTWNCTGGGDRGGHLVTSVDHGRTWQVQSHRATAGMALSDPFTVGDDAVLVWAGPNAEKAPIVMITIRPGEG